jgi:HAD superfamily hydrolase (TIGR01509 family)
MAAYEGPEAAVFDLDGVVTFTAQIHAAAWKQLFDDYLRSRHERLREPFQEFDLESDYRAFVDGRPRYQGVQAFLQSRGIHLPMGAPADSARQETICGLGNRKNTFFLLKVQELGVDVDQEAVQFICNLRDLGVRIGLASSSKNAGPILERVGLAELFQERVDGVVSERLGLQGKPQPDIFLKCLQLLTGQTDARRAMVVEDAISGVQAGKAGGFGLVLGVDRNGEAASLREHGADWVISHFREISTSQVLDYFRSRAHVA